MKKVKNVSRNGVLVLVATMLLTIPNMTVYSAVGNYQSNSLALIANNDYNASSVDTGKAFWPAVLAVAAGVGLAVVAAVGAVDGWNAIHPNPPQASLDFGNNYDDYDFSKFDN